MASNREKDFGLLISTVLPGFAALLGFADYSATLRLWIGLPGSDAPSVGGFLLLTVASVFVGLTVGTVRWMTIDTIHHLTGVKKPEWQFSNLKNREHAFGVMIDIHYRYYLFYSNSIVAIPIFLVGRWVSRGFSFLELIAAVATMILFFAGSRDTLRKYYNRVESLLAS